jgi:hypothetical protein
MIYSFHNWIRMSCLADICRVGDLIGDQSGFVIGPASARLALAHVAAVDHHDA